ncbi:diacylglycerol/lipid kinase family protein [Frondihabitans cladoniiphilus]|uniref:diacylglycerol/lipid kinase family protein n=1 Tax=Frondihabitans cladoniiphilus TaxID=715785 RepID=UPI0031EB968E
MHPASDSAPVRGRVAVVYNPIKVKVAKLRASVAAEERRSGWAESTWHETAASDDGRAAAQEAASTTPDVVLIVGGDGTLRVAAEVLHTTGIPMALLPVGTGNLFARNLRLPLNDIDLSVRTAFTGANRPIDIAFAELEAEGQPPSRHAFLVMAGVGLDASMAANTNARLKKRVGWLAYTDPIARSVFGNKQIDLSYRRDDEKRRSMAAHTVIVGNCGTLTANILLLPAAVPDDGILDAVAFRPRGGAGWTKIGYGLAFNRFFHRTAFGRFLALFLPTSRTLRYTTARRLELRFARPEEIQLDGDPFGLVTAATLTVLHHGLTLRAPSPS